MSYKSWRIIYKNSSRACWTRGIRFYDADGLITLGDKSEITTGGNLGEGYNWFSTDDGADKGEGPVALWWNATNDKRDDDPFSTGQGSRVFHKDNKVFFGIHFNQRKTIIKIEIASSQTAQKNFGLGGAEYPAKVSELGANDFFIQGSNNADNTQVGKGYGNNLSGTWDDVMRVQVNNDNPGVAGRMGSDLKISPNGELGESGPFSGDNLNRKDVRLIIIGDNILYSSLEIMASGYGAKTSDTINKTDDLALINTDFTIEAWFNNNTFNNFARIVDKSTSGYGVNGYSLALSGDHPRLQFYSNGSLQMQSSTTMTLNQWNHIVFSFKNSNNEGKIYINEVLDKTETLTSKITGETNCKLAIGNWPHTDGIRYLKGNIAEVRIWKSLLTESQILEYKNKQLDNSHPQKDKLVGYWKCNEGSGYTIANSAHLFNQTPSSSFDLIISHMTNSNPPTSSQVAFSNLSPPNVLSGTLPAFLTSPPTTVSDGENYIYDIQFSGNVTDIQVGKYNDDGISTSTLPNWLIFSQNGQTASLEGAASHSDFLNNPYSYNNIFVKLLGPEGNAEQGWDITVNEPPGPAFTNERLVISVEDGTSVNWSIPFENVVTQVRAGLKYDNSPDPPSYSFALPLGLSLKLTHAQKATIEGEVDFNLAEQYKNIFVKLTGPWGEVEQEWDITVTRSEPVADFNLRIDGEEEKALEIVKVKDYNEKPWVNFLPTQTNKGTLRHEWTIGKKDEAENFITVSGMSGNKRNHDAQEFTTPGTYQISYTVTNVEDDESDGLSKTETKKFILKWKPKRPTLRSQLWGEAAFGPNQVPLQKGVIYDVSDSALYATDDEVIVTEISSTSCVISSSGLSFTITPNQESDNETINLKVKVHNKETGYNSPEVELNLTVIAPPKLLEYTRAIGGDLLPLPNSGEGEKRAPTLSNYDFPRIQDNQRFFNLHVDSTSSLNSKIILKRASEKGTVKMYNNSTQTYSTPVTKDMELPWGTRLKFEDNATWKNIVPINDYLLFDIVDEYGQTTETRLNISLDSIVSAGEASRISAVGKGSWPWVATPWPHGIIHAFLSNWTTSSSTPDPPPPGIERKKYQVFIRGLLSPNTTNPNYAFAQKVKTDPILTERLFLPFNATKSKTILFNSGATIDITDLNDNSFYSPIMEVDEQITIKPRSGSNFTIRVTTAGGETAENVAILTEYEITGDPTMEAVSRLDPEKWQTGDEVILNGEKIFLGGVGGNGSEDVQDNINPTLDSVSISSSNSNTGLAKADDIITLTFTASETIQEPVVTFQSGGVDVTNNITYENTSENTWTAKYTAHASDTDGNVTFSIEFVDEVGNAGTPVTSGSGAVTFDNTNSTLSSVGIVSSNSEDNQLAKAGDIITLTFTASETIQEPVVTFKSGGVDVTNNITYENTSENTWTAKYTAHTSDTGGNVTYSIEFADEVGNAGTPVTSGSGTVTFDNINPTLNPVSISSSRSEKSVRSKITNAARVGDTITLTFTASETIQTPTVTFRSGGAAVANSPTVSNVGNDWTVTYDMSSSDTDGYVTFSIEFADEVGNEGTNVIATTDNTNVRFEKEKPNYHRDRIKDRTWQKSFFPPGRNVSVANQYHHHQMSKRAIAALGTANSTTGNTTVKKHRAGNSKPRTENGVSAAARQPRALQQSSSLRSRSRPYHGRRISIGNGGILTPSARAVGSMDRLARLKAAAMGGTKNKPKK